LRVESKPGIHQFALIRIVNLGKMPWSVWL